MTGFYPLSFPSLMVLTIVPSLIKFNKNTNVKMTDTGDTAGKKKTQLKVK